MDDRGHLVSTDPLLTNEVDEVNGTRAEGVEAQEAKQTEKVHEYSDNNMDDEEEGEGETTIMMSGALPVAEEVRSTTIEGSQRRKQCMEDGCKRHTCKRNGFLCDMHHDQALLLERQMVTKRKRRGDNIASIEVTDGSQETAALNNQANTLPSSSDTCAEHETRKRRAQGKTPK